MDNTIIYKWNMQMKIIWYKYDIKLKYTEKEEIQYNYKCVVYMYFILIKWSKHLKEKHLVMHNLHAVNFDIKIKNMLLWRNLLMSSKDTEGNLKISDWYQNLIIFETKKLLH